MIGATVVWDWEEDPNGNLQHIAENGLTIEEVEDVLFDSASRRGSSRSIGRPTTYGWTSTRRHIVVVWEVIEKEPLMIRVVTAYETRPPKR
jgi:uncharacterized DUF497 family protein